MSGLDAKFGDNAIHDEAMTVVSSAMTFDDLTDLGVDAAVAAINAGYVLEASNGIDTPHNPDDFVEV